MEFQVKKNVLMQPALNVNFIIVTENLHIGNNGHQLLSLQWSKETTSLARKVTEEYLLLSCYQY